MLLFLMRWVTSDTLIIRIWCLIRQRTLEIEFECFVVPARCGDSIAQYYSMHACS